MLGYEPVAPFRCTSSFFYTEGWYHRGILRGYLKDANLFPYGSTFTIGLTQQLVAEIVAIIVHVSHAD